MDWIEIKIDGAWDVIWLVGSLIAIMTSGNYVVAWIRSNLQKKTEANKLDTIKVVKQQIDILEEQFQSLTIQFKSLFSTNEETKLHKIELMKSNVILQEQVNKLKKENLNCAELLKDFEVQNTLLKEQNLLLSEQVKELRQTKEVLKKDLRLVREENEKLKTGNNA